jgi:hypothetical protein
MAKERITLTDERSARVMFASDRTCCVCRIEKHKVQIHHIDEDPSNNAFENLAVICLHCHSDAHTNGAFVRNLTADLIRLYNESWRQAVAIRLQPNEPDAEKMGYAAEGYFEIARTLDDWRRGFLHAAMEYAGTWPQRTYEDEWESTLAIIVAGCSRASYEHFLKIMRRLSHIRSDLDRINTLFADVLPYEFRSLLVRANRQFGVERGAYEYLPLLVNPKPEGEDGFKELDPHYRERLQSALRMAAFVARDADKRRYALYQSSGGRPRSA